MEQLVTDLFTRYLGSPGGRYSWAVDAEGAKTFLPDGRATTVPEQVDRIVPLTAWISTGGSPLFGLPSRGSALSADLPRKALSARLGDLFTGQWFSLARRAPVQVRRAGRRLARQLHGGSRANPGS